MLPIPRPRRFWRLRAWLLRARLRWLTAWRRYVDWPLAGLAVCVLCTRNLHERHTGYLTNLDGTRQWFWSCLRCDAGELLDAP